MKKPEAGLPASGGLIKRRDQRPLGSALTPAYTALRPSSCSMRRSWLYLAVRSVRLSEPVLIWPQLVATAMSAMSAMVAMVAMVPHRANPGLLRGLPAEELSRRRLRTILP